MDYQTKTNLILPFKGTLFVSNGGRDASTNNHFRPADQGLQSMLYAYDFRDEFTGLRKNLDNYEVYGKEVLAAGDGKVVQIIDGSIDVLLGERDRGVGVGNAIIIDHQNGEFSLLCHFKHRSIRVKEGDLVKQGEVVGLCGNTGNTTEPHIHFHLQNSQLTYKANGLPAQFRKILVNGEIKENYEPIRGDFVSNT